MERTLRPRNRRKTDQPIKYLQEGEDGKRTPTVDDEQEGEDDDIKEMPVDVSKEDETEKKRSLKRKAEKEDEESSEKKVAPKATISPPTKALTLVDKIIGAAAASAASPRKQLKRESEGPLLSIEEQKLMETDVLTLLKRFAPKYYVPLPKIWAIPKSQLTTAQSQKT